MSPEDVIQGILEEIGGSAGTDYIFLIESVRAISELFDKIGGILIVVLIVMIPLLVALEVAYINFPILQDMVGRPNGTTRGQERILGLVLRDAQRAIIKYEKQGRARSINAVYFGIKFKSLIIAFIIIACILGLGPYIIAIIIGIAQGIINALF